jgi:hypothetical protein
MTEIGNARFIGYIFGHDRIAFVMKQEAPANAKTELPSG